METLLHLLPDAQAMESEIFVVCSGGLILLLLQIARLYFIASEQPQTVHDKTINEQKKACARKRMLHGVENYRWSSVPCPCRGSNRVCGSLSGPRVLFRDRRNNVDRLLDLFA